MNLLTDPVFSISCGGKQMHGSLPTLLHLLGQDRVDGLPGIQKYQEAPFHVFLCQLAAMAMVRGGLTSPKESAQKWLAALRLLSKCDGVGDDNTWTLVVEDVTKPAFMQSPSSTTAVFKRDFKLKGVSPESIDTLQTAKNHDVKGNRNIGAPLESWAYSLISLQTTVGFLGAGNYSVSRMNGGFGSRVIVGWQDSLRFGGRFSLDVERLLAMREETILQFGYRNDGLGLVWTKKWDGVDSLALSALDPDFIEVARRIRLTKTVVGIVANGAPSKAMRIAAKELKGNLGDSWMPISVKSNGALTVQESGFTPQLMRNIIFEDGYVAAKMQKLSQKKGDGWLTASVLVRGQGITDGFHEAQIRVPASARPLLFGGGAARDRIAVLSKKGIDLSAGIASTLRYALTAFLEGGPDKVSMDKREIGSWVNSVSRQFDAAWSNAYFEWLWGCVHDADDLVAQNKWFNSLKSKAEAVLQRAFLEAPLRSGRTYKARNAAEGAFFGGLYKKFPEFMEAKQ